MIWLPWWLLWCCELLHCCGEIFIVSEKKVTRHSAACFGLTEVWCIIAYGQDHVTGFVCKWCSGLQQSLEIVVYFLMFAAWGPLGQLQWHGARLTSCCLLHLHNREKFLLFGKWTFCHAHQLGVQCLLEWDIGVLIQSLVEYENMDDLVVFNEEDAETLLVLPQCIQA